MKPEIKVKVKPEVKSKTKSHHDQSAHPRNKSEGKVDEKIKKPPAGTKRKVFKCPQDDEGKVERDYKKSTGQKDTRKRQRPCHGTDKPIIEYTERLRKIGTYYTWPFRKVISIFDDPLFEPWLEFRGYKLGKGKLVIQVSQSPDTPFPGEFFSEQTWLDRKLNKWLGKKVQEPNPEIREQAADWLKEKAEKKIGKKCKYDVYLQEKRRKCTCPDGSPCKSTTKK